MLLRPVLFASFFVFFCGFAQARDFSQVERAFIDRYLQEQNLNRFGDAQGTLYAGGTPLFDETTGHYTDRHEYVLRKHPHILDGFIGILPVDPVRKASALAGALQSTGVASQSSRMYLETLVSLEAENGLLVASIRDAVDRKDYQAIEQVLQTLDGMDRGRLAYFSSVLKDVRRMLQAPTIDEIRVTQKVRELLIRVNNLENRLRA